MSGPFRVQVAALLWAVLAGCAASSDRMDAVVAPAEGRAVPAGAPAPVPAELGRVLFDLRANRHLAHVTRHGGPFVDARSPSVLKHVRGGWAKSGWRVDVPTGGETALASTGRNAVLTLPLTEVGRSGIAELGATLKPVKPGTRVSVFLNEYPLGDLELSGEDWETVRVPVGTGVAAAGENRVRFFVAATGKLDGEKAGLLVGALWLGRAGAPPPEAWSDYFPSAAADSEPGAADGFAPGGLRLPGTGDGLAWYVQVPGKARLWLDPAPAGGCALDVFAWEDDAPPTALSRVRPAGIPAAVDLSAWAGRTIRLEIVAAGEACRDLVLRRAAIVGPPEPPSVPVPTEAPPADHVVVWVVDAMRADVLGAAGGTHVHTPNLDALAASGAVFPRAATQGSETKLGAAALFTGTYPSVNGLWTDDDRIRTDLPILPELFKAAGFRTGAWISNGYVSGRWGFKRGWDAYSNFIRERMPTHADLVARTAMEWLEKERPARSLVYLHPADTHVTYRAHPGILERYDPAPYAGPFLKAVTGFDLAAWKSGRVRWTDRDKARLVALYRNEATYNDQVFGELMKELPKVLTGRIAVLVTADHGEELFDHGSVGHGHSLFDEITSVPLIVADGGARFPAGAVVREDAEMVDVLPTLLGAAGIRAPATAQGLDLAPLAARSTDPRYVRPAFSFHQDWWRTLRLGRWKLHLRGSERLLLFDVTSDPGEKHDVAESRPVALRHCLDVATFFLRYGERWHKSVHGEVSNHTDAFAGNAEAHTL